MAGFQIRPRQALQYGLSFSIAAFLFYWLYRDVDMAEMFAKLGKANFGWVLLSMLLGAISHLSRGARWRLALAPLGYRVSVSRAFFAVMTGYLGNLLLPRAGELVRCVALDKNAGVPTEVSLGTVITERTFDFLVLLTLCLLTFWIEISRLEQILGDKIDLQTYQTQLDGLLAQSFWLVPLVVLLFLGLLFVVFKFKTLFFENKLAQKIRQFVKGLVAGLLSIRNLTWEQRLGYLFHTFVIWLMYFLMLYVLFFSLESTAHLGWDTCNLLIVMGGIGMIVPVQGGIGAYHFLTQITLMSYGISESDSKYFAFLAHSCQTLMVILMGTIAFVFLSMTKKKSL
ncbi:lysylphosphatidylglycerol synthase transmembrane domain-containing protein [Hugenholtzia roseola]|uniref:lysylphosphatidylglycerol synthase transmembrane domain-containing protein n=1 Tax=Hugenholtzia roseola TaxID=1002 RepID=UPI00040361F4|nr:lysylphosphatidylglycerol synthase transmembrane domain-containing protein [Hugenholtzia roseola]